MLIIFDFDGLILDTETHEYEVLQEMFEEHGSTLPSSVWGKVIGTAAGFKPFAYLEEQLGRKPDHDELTAIRRGRFEQRMKTETARPGGGLFSRGERIRIEGGARFQLRF